MVRGDGKHEKSLELICILTSLLHINRLCKVCLYSCLRRVGLSIFGFKVNL